MNPVVFDGCFGWLHPGHGARGVVLCGAFGHENMNAHRGWRLLAERLSERGLHVLRFDYPGTGDSIGDATDPDRVGAWQRSIAAAVDHLRAATGTERVILVGLRLGATLALAASGTIAGIDAVCCLAPVLSGRNHVRELRLLANAWREANLLPALEGPGPLDVVGDRLTGETLAAIAALDLRRVRTEIGHVLLMQDAEGPAVASLIESLGRQGCEVSRLPFPGATDYLQNSLGGGIPAAAFDSLVAWCCALDPLPGLAAAASEPLRRRSTVEPAPARLDLPHAQERSFRFGDGARLFGMLCVPRRVERAGPTVLMLNTGFGRHIGDGRVFVTLARRLASQGIASLRMDVGGFGDSAASDPGNGEARPNPYAVANIADVIAAVNALEGEGHTRPVVVAICSGAYAAFRAALSEPRIRGAILVNLQAFIWKQGASLTIENRRQRRPLGFYLRTLLRPRTWKRLGRGEVELGALLVALGRRPMHAAWRELCLLLERATGLRTASGEVPRLFASLQARGIRTRLLYSEGDPGLSVLSHGLGRPARRLRTLPALGVDLLPRADHALLDEAARSRFIDLACDIVREDWTSGAAGASGAVLWSPSALVPKAEPAPHQPSRTEPSCA